MYQSTQTCLIVQNRSDLSYHWESFDILMCVLLGWEESFNMDLHKWNGYRSSGNGFNLFSSILLVFLILFLLSSTNDFNYSPALAEHRGCESFWGHFLLSLIDDNMLKSHQLRQLIKNVLNVKLWTVCGWSKFEFVFSRWEVTSRMFVKRDDETKIKNSKLTQKMCSNQFSSFIHDGDDVTNQKCLSFYGFWWRCLITWPFMVATDDTSRVLLSFNHSHSI